MFICNSVSREAMSGIPLQHSDKLYNAHIVTLASLDRVGSETPPFNLEIKLVAFTRSQSMYIADRVHFGRWPHLFIEKMRVEA